MPGWLRHVSTSAALVRLTQREGAEDREAARIVAHRLEGHLGGVGIPARRMDHRGVDAALVHQSHRLLGRERRDLAMGHVARQPATPEMDLGVHDAHHAPPSSVASALRRQPESISVDEMPIRVVESPAAVAIGGAGRPLRRPRWRGLLDADRPRHPLEARNGTEPGPPRHPAPRALRRRYPLRRYRPLRARCSARPTTPSTRTKPACPHRRPRPGAAQCRRAWSSSPATSTSSSPSTSTRATAACSTSSPTAATAACCGASTTAAAPT